MNVMVPHSAASRTQGRCIRSMRWHPRSWISVSAACSVARTIGERLSHASNRTVSTRVLEPSVPGGDAWNILLDGAYVRTMRGSRATAAVVLRDDDAAKLVNAALGESAGSRRELSRIERRVLHDVVDAAVPALSSICGGDMRDVERADEFFTYFDVLAEMGPVVRIGIAASDVHPLPPAATLRIEDLASVEVTLTAELRGGDLTASALLRLRPGDIVPMTTKVDSPGVLRLAGGAVAARGECGALGSHFALKLVR